MVAGETGLELKQQEKQQTVSALGCWIKQQLIQLMPDTAATDLAAAVDNWQPLGGDAGFRHYFRLANVNRGEAKALMAVWSPPATEKNAEFVGMAQHLKAGGLKSPDILAYQPETGFILIEDLGEQLLLDVLTPSTVESLYGQALDTLLQLQQCSQNNPLYGRYDLPELMREMALFSEWFVPQLLGYKTNEQEQALIVDAFKYLASVALEQPVVVVHRDYHSRNLVYREHQPLGVIDFQDGLIGPITYDLVSLLRDCYIQWPQEQVQQWALAYAKKATAAGLMPSVSDAQFLRWFDCMGLQRHIKVLGIFARLWLRDGKAAYLHDLPLVIEYTRTVASRYTELQPFVQWFDNALMPLINVQPWMKKS